MTMTDIHCHILPHIDDGAKDIEESLAMAEIAVADGISGIICTPHALREYDVLIDKEEAARVNLQNRLDECGIALRLYRGFEVYVSENLLDYEHIERLCLGGSKHILIETDFDVLPRCMEEALYLLRITGLIPILAHPERYLYLKKNIALCEMWKKEGMLFQMNAGSIMGLYGGTAQKLAKKLLKKGYIDFIGTDAHSSNRRAPYIQGAVSGAKRLCGEQEIVRVLDNNNSLADQFEVEEK